MSFGKLMSDFRGVCGIKGCRGCSQEFGIDKDVWERVRLWWREVSCPPPRACNSGFSSITPCPSSLCCPLTPLILSRSASAKFLNHELSVGFFVVVSCRLLLCRYPYKLFFFYDSDRPPLTSSCFYLISLFSVFIFPSLSPPSHLSSSPYTLAPGESHCGCVVYTVCCQGLHPWSWFMSAFTAGMFA